MIVHSRLITIEWEGPFSLVDVKEKFSRSTDYGIYQIYGTHNIFGANSLLYIGKAQEKTFAERISDHLEWIEWESGSVEIYLGRLGGTDSVTKNEEEWEADIDCAERLLIYFSSPPYNSSCIKSYGNISDVTVINYKKRQRLPIEVSTYYEDTIKDHSWKIYGNVGS